MTQVPPQSDSTKGTRRARTTVGVAIVAGLATLAALVALIATQSAKHIAACHSLAFDGCNAGYYLALAASTSVPGGGSRVTVTARDPKTGLPAAGVVVSITYEGQPTVLARTNAYGTATGYFTQRAGRSTYTAETKAPGPWFTADRATATARLTVTADKSHFPSAYLPVLYQTGAYSVATASAAEAASAAGIHLLHTDTANLAMRGAAAAGRSVVIDSQPSNIVYATLCSKGAQGCHAATSTDLATIQRRTMTALTSAVAKSTATAAWYVLDDYRFASFATALQMIHSTLRAAGDSRPTVCGFGLHLARIGDQADATQALKAFRATLINYSPRWCDIVMIYSQPPGMRYAVPSSSYDWTLSSILPQALSMLRQRGWSPATQPLFASPATFGYIPRQGAGQVEYRSLPTATELTQEIKAYCAIGATSIVGYVWRDASLQPNGQPEPELWNTPSLRIVLTSATRDCRAEYWQ